MKYWRPVGITVAVLVGSAGYLAMWLHDYGVSWGTSVWIAPLITGAALVLFVVVVVVGALLEERKRLSPVEAAEKIGEQWRSEGFWITYMERSEGIYVYGAKKPEFDAIERVDMVPRELA